MAFLLMHFALVTAALFAGAAIYISVAEHPARMQLDDGAALAQWKPSYHEATKLQVSFAIASVVLAATAVALSGDWRWLVGGLLMLANLPYTLLLVMPTNKVLKATEIAQAGGASRALLHQWARLHAVRCGLALAAIVAYLWALS